MKYHELMAFCSVRHTISMLHISMLQRKVLCLIINTQYWIMLFWSHYWRVLCLHSADGHIELSSGFKREQTKLRIPQGVTYHYTQQYHALPQQDDIKPTQPPFNVALKRASSTACSTISTPTTLLALRAYTHTHTADHTATGNQIRGCLAVVTLARYRPIVPVPQQMSANSNIRG